jgi:hypothetical protein
MGIFGIAAGYIGIAFSLIVIATFVALFTESSAVFVQYLQSPLALVLGFWFGKGLPSRA